MKKFIAPLLAILLLCGCAKEKEQAPAPTESTEPVLVTTAPPTRPPVVVPEVEEVPEADNPLFDPWDCEVLVGQWEMTVKIPSDFMNVPDYTGTASFPVVWTFDEDGRYTVTLEQKSYSDAILGYENQLVEFMMDGHYSRFVAEKMISDLSDEEIQYRWEWTDQGRSKYQAMTHEFLDEFGLRDIYTQLIRGGYYYVEEDVLHLTFGEEEETFQFKVDEEGLTLSNSSRIGFYDRTLRIRFPTALKPLDQAG